MAAFVDETITYDQAQAELIQTDQLIQANDEKLTSFDQELGTLELKLRSLLSSPEYDDWRPNIQSLIGMLTIVHNEKLVPLKTLMTELQTSAEALHNPITHQRIILLGKTRSGKSNFGNAVLGRYEYPTSDRFVSMTKVSKMNDITYKGKLLEFIDTQGLDDTENPEEVIPKLHQLIKDISWQYTSVFYLLKFDSLSEEGLTEVTRFLQDLFGNQVVQRTILVFTHCPTSKRYKSFAVCKEMLMSELDHKPRVKHLLKLYLGIKFVDFQEKTEDMPEDEAEFIETKRQKERNIILDDLITMPFTLSNPGFLKQFILSHVHVSILKMAELEAQLKDVNRMFTTAQKKKNIIFRLTQLGMFFGGSGYREFYNVDKTLWERFTHIFRQ